MENEITGIGEPTVSTIPRTLEDSYLKRMGKLIELSEAEERNLKAWLKKQLNDWESDTSDLHKILEEDNDLVEGYVDEPSGIYEGWGSNVHVDVTGIYMEVYQSIEKRSILGADQIWYAVPDPEAEDAFEIVADIDEMLNYKARNEWNISQAIPMAIWAKNRDGLCAVQVTWEENYKKSNDVILITSEDEFIERFPAPESAGVDENQWKELRTYVAQNATEETPVEIPITFNKLVYHGNKAHVVEYADFVVLPATAPNIYEDCCRGYGKRFQESKDEIRPKIKDEIYYKQSADSLLSKKPKEVNSYVQSKDYVEGLKRSRANGYVNFELVVKGRLKGEDDEEGKYLVVYNLENDILLRCVEYFYRIDFYAVFVLNKRPNRLGGVSIPRKTRETNEEVDVQHNQRINSHAISGVPTFITSTDTDWDPQAPENRWRPGLRIKTDKPFQQFIVQPTDQGNSMQEEANSFRILDLSLGSPASLFSGQSDVGDPNAPGNKTAMLINQGNMRMEDVLDEDRDGVSMIGQICLSHMYQFGQNIIKWTSSNIGANGQTLREVRTIHRKFLANDIKMHMKGINVIKNPESEMAKAAARHQLLMAEPLFANDADLRIKSLREVLKAGRDPVADNLLPPAEVVQQKQIELQKQAILQLQAEKIMQEKQAQEQALKERIGKAQQDLQIRRLAERSAEANLSNNTPDEVANG